MLWNDNHEVNTSTTSHSWNFVGWRWEMLRSTLLATFKQASRTLLLTIVVTLYIISPERNHLITRSLYPRTTFTQWDTTSCLLEWPPSKGQVLARTWKKGNPCALLVGMKIGAATVENSIEIPQRIKYRTTIWLGNPSPGCLSKEIKSGSQRDISAPPCSLQCYSQ